MHDTEWEYGRTVSDDKIRSVETRLGVVFPHDYRAVVAKYSGGRPKPNVVDVSPERAVVLERLLSIDERQVENVTITTEILRESGRGRLLPFAVDPFGNLFCFQVEGECPVSVIHWEHESGNVSTICRTFSQLLEMLHDPRG